ncbi:NBR1-Ig-like domain-containing protein [Actinocorallia populi]|uniref:NBR1-Ig-like domain-containing protein n=1 Tax=Actinocorallia populi TaxID=2079200 RepID=UPI000D08B67B|nr:NBR1-Ig-like domain-containing protein [Actinocorallia populi]
MRPDPAEGPVAAFADRLWRLKVEAGDPSFAEMSSRLGAAASKSSLAAAAQGRTLASWGTTWEFVRVLAVERLGRDAAETEREWRELWRRTKALAELDDADLVDADVAAERTESVVGAAETVAPEAAAPEAAAPGIAAPETAVPEAVVPEARSAEPEPDVVTAPHVVRMRRLRLNTGAVAAVIAFAVLAVVVGGAAFLLKDDPAGRPPAARPSFEVDDSVFEGDITYPDGTLVRQGEEFEKVWRIRNAGTVEWEGRFLMRANDAICAAPDRVEIPRTRPGESVDIRVRVRTPKESGSCRIYWKMVDRQGRTLFPGKRPIFLDVRVG